MHKPAISRIAFASWPRGYTRVVAAVTVYGAASALLLERAPAILGPEHTWIMVLVVPALTLLVAALRTGTGLAVVLAYAFVSATAMAVQGYRLGWAESAQLESILAHLASVVFLAAAVAAVSVLRTAQLNLAQAQEMIARYLSEDETSGLLTPSAFENAACRELDRSRRTSRPFLLVAIDVSEYFEPAQGSLSIESGHRVLGRILRTQTRGNFDLWTLWKEGLYLGLLLETDKSTAGVVLDRIAHHMAGASEFDGAALVQKTRVGFATYPGDDDTFAALVAAATANMVPLRKEP